MDSEVIARLKELESKATAGPWVATAEKNEPGTDEEYGHQCYIIGADGMWPPIILCPFRYHSHAEYCRELPDLEFIAALRTHAKALIRAAELGEAMKEALTAIATYPPVGGRRADDGYPSEVVYDEFAYKRIIDSYRRVANDALAALEAPPLPTETKSRDGCKPSPSVTHADMLRLADLGEQQGWPVLPKLLREIFKETP